MLALSYGWVRKAHLFARMAITTEFSAALNQICAEKGLPPEAVLETIKAALVSAYRKDNPEVPAATLNAEVNSETGEARIFHGGKDVTPAGFGRIASQTAKQILLQKLREAEKEAVIKEYRQKVGAIVSGHVFRVDKGTAILDLGRTQGIMPPAEQLPGEQYRINQRYKVLIKEVREEGRASRGPEIVVSRADPRFVQELFALEVPELSSGVVEVKSIAREAGQRTKIAVASREERVDPVGSCVGQKGVRVQAVISELGSERIDIIEYDEEPKKFVANALSPAKVREVILDERQKRAKVRARDDQLSLAIGREGQNVRLAAKLTGWRIDIRGEREEKVAEDKAAEARELSALGLSKRVESALVKAGIKTVGAVRKMLEKKAKVAGIGPKAIKEINQALSGTGKKV